MKQATPLVAVQLRGLLRDVRRRARTLPTAAERIAMIQARGHILRGFPHNEGRFRTNGSGGVTGAAYGGGRGVHFQLLVRKDVAKLLPSGCRKNLDCREICAVAAVVEYQKGAESMQWPLAAGSGFLFPSILEGGDKGDLALTPAQMTANLQTHLRAAGMEDKR